MNLLIPALSTWRTSTYICAGFFFAALAAFLSIFLFAKEARYFGGITGQTNQVHYLVPGENLAGGTLVGTTDDGASIGMKARFTSSTPLGDSHMEVVDVEMKVETADGTVHTAEAKHGSFSPDQDSVVLHGDVTLSTDNEVSIRSESMIVSLSDMRFSTAGEVLVHFPGGFGIAGMMKGYQKNNAVGVDFGDQILELQDRVYLVFDK